MSRKPYIYMPRTFEALTLEELIALWEELTINLPYTKLLVRYAEIACVEPRPTAAGDQITLKLMREFEARGMTAPLPDWIRSA
jgi:hypothetical protein